MGKEAIESANQERQGRIDLYLRNIVQDGIGHLGLLMADRMTSGDYQHVQRVTIEAYRFLSGKGYSVPFWDMDRTFAKLLLEIEGGSR